MSVLKAIAPAALCIAVVASGFSRTLSVSAQTPAPKGNAQNGEKLFVKYGCFECHGREGQGGGLAGPRIAPNTPAVAAFIRYVRAPRGEMPAYTEKLLKSDQDLIDIQAYLASRPGPKPEKIPAP